MVYPSSGREARNAIVDDDRAVVCLRRNGQVMAVATAIERLAAFVPTTYQGELPGGLVHAARRAIVDWMAATLAGSVMEPARVLAGNPAIIGDPGPCLVVPTGTGAGLRPAALINGTAAHVAELDDIYRDGIYHPGAPTVAAALAAGQYEDVDGDRLVRAVVAGYEVGDRVAAAVNPAHYRFWHTTGTVGALGSAAAVAAVLSLSETRTAHALATATTMAAGLQQAFRSDAMSKPLHSGHAAESGVLAAYAAKDGFTGALDVLDGPAGFGAAMSDNPAWDTALEGMGTSAHRIEQTTVKNHAACGHTFAAIDAMLALRADGLEADQVERVRVRTYRIAVDVAGHPRPETEFEARFSIAYCISVALLCGAVRLEAFRADRLADTAVRELMRRVEVEVDPELDGLFPGQRAASVEVETRDGSVLKRLQNTRKGDPDDPLSDAELCAKFNELARPIAGDGLAARLLDTLWSLDASTRVRSLAVGGGR